jgi:glycosyltransferase involved in cell wall biosynthesis
MYAPLVLGSKPPVPYSIITDYTQAQCANWPLWQNGSKRKNKEFIACQRLAYENASYIFTFSDIARESLCKEYGIAESKVKTVGSGGDIREVFVGEKSFGTKQLLVSGTDWRRKGADIAVDALRIVRKTIPDATLVILGDCKRQVAEPGVHYSGFIKERGKIDEIFANTDVFLSPARCDPFPGLVLEAMNRGIPVLASDKDGMPEMIDNGACGGIVSLDPADLAAKIIALLSDEKQLREKSDAARRRIREKYNWDIITKLIIDTWLADPAK